MPYSKRSTHGRICSPMYRNLSSSRISKSPHDDFCKSPNDDHRDATLMHGAGLRNLGNTCFANSVLQTLTHSQVFVDAVRASSHRDFCEENADGDCFLCVMEKHIVLARNLNNIPLAPQAVVDCFPKISPSLIQGNQEDAHEFLRGAIDAMQKSIPQNDPDRFQEYPFSLFAGGLQSCVRCTSCKKSSIRIDPIEDLQLNIDRTNTLEAALASLTRKESLTGDNAYECDHCKRKTDAFRSSSLSKIPPILSIQLKRFSFNRRRGTKITHFVQYPEILDLSEFMQKEKGKGKKKHKPAIANLFAVVVHIGRSLEVGHYIAYVKTKYG